MRKILTSLLVLIFLFVTVLSFRLPQSAVIAIVSILAASVIIPTIITAYFGVMMAREKFQTLRTQHQKEKYIIHNDGYGMVHLIDTTNGHSQNLTIDARAYRNGHYEPPTQEEINTLRYILASRHAGGFRGAGDLLLPATIEPVPDLMAELRTAQRVLIKAASNGGKTTLLQHIAAQRVSVESVLILDSQSYPDKWPAGCKVVGAGANHQAISNALDNLITLMVKRYQEIGQGIVKEGQHPRLTIIIDEWMAIVDQCHNASDAIRRLLTESRKAAFSVFIGSHSERVKSLGLDGRGDLRDGFLIVRIELENGQRVATYDTGRGERSCLLPGEFVQPQPDNLIEIEAITTSEPDEDERRVLDMLAKGASYRAISTAVWGQRGTFYNARIEAIARKYGREVRSV